MIPLVFCGMQERFRYCGAKMLPKGSMGYVEPGELPPSDGAAEAPMERAFLVSRSL